MQLHAQNPNDVGLAAQTVPDQEPDWDCNTQGGTRNRNTMIQCLLAGIKQCIRKPVNENKIREITQGKEENPTLFHNRLVEVFRKYSDLDLSLIHI